MAKTKRLKFLPSNLMWSLTYLRLAAEISIYTLRKAVCIEESLGRHQIAGITALRTGLPSYRKQPITWTNDGPNNWWTYRSPGLCGLGITFHHWENSPFYITITIKAQSSSREFNKTWLYPQRVLQNQQWHSRQHSLINDFCKAHL